MGALILRLLFAIARRRPYWHIYSGGSLYMRRWWLLGGSSEVRDSDADRPEGQPRLWKRGWFDALVGRLFCVRLHHIVRADEEREFHDHPCAFLSIVLTGGYVEELPDDQGQPPADDAFWRRAVRRGPGSIRFRRARDRHAIRHVATDGAWTVFVMFGRKRQWGFYEADGWVPSSEYFGRKPVVPV